MSTDPVQRNSLRSTAVQILLVVLFATLLAILAFAAASVVQL